MDGDVGVEMQDIIVSEQITRAPIPMRLKTLKLLPLYLPCFEPSMAAGSVLSKMLDGGASSIGAPASGAGGMKTGVGPSDVC